MQVLHTPLYIQDLSISWFGDPGGDTKDSGVGSFPVTPALARYLLSPSHISLPLYNTVLVPLFPLSHPSNLVIILWGNPGNVEGYKQVSEPQIPSYLSWQPASPSRHVPEQNFRWFWPSLWATQLTQRVAKTNCATWSLPNHRLQRKINIFKFYSSLSSSKRSPKQTFGADFAAN